tara:strand:+ start:87 stop:527 length:441 start_codon:yes stop_codon:yes gene_type:complete
MPDVGKVLRDEISRLAKKEVKQATDPLMKHIRDLQKTVREQRQRITTLEKGRAKKSEKTSVPKIVPGDGQEVVRIPEGSIKKQRERLGLSQREMGLLLDVTALSVSNWERGEASPRGQNRDGFAALRKMGRRDVRERLEKLAEAAG